MSIIEAVARLDDDEAGRLGQALDGNRDEAVLAGVREALKASRGELQRIVRGRSVDATAASALRDGLRQRADLLRVLPGNQARNQLTATEAALELVADLAEQLGGRHAQEQPQ